MVSCIPQNEMVVFAGDMNGHVGSSNVGYDGTHGGFGYGSRNADGSRILEFADGLNLVICNTLFTKQEAKLVTYVAGPAKSTVDYIMVRQEDKAKIRNVKVITSEECVPKHKLLVMAGAKTVVRTVYGNSKGFEVKVGMQQGSEQFINFLFRNLVVVVLGRRHDGSQIVVNVDAYESGSTVQFSTHMFVHRFGMGSMWRSG